MPRTLDPGWITEIQRQHGQVPFAWLFDIPLFTSDVLHLRAAITSHPSALVFGPITFQPWPCKLAPIEESIEGDLPQLALSLSNHGRMLMRYFQPDDLATGPVGRNLNVRLVKVDSLATAMFFSWRIASVPADARTVTLRLEELNWWEIDVPQDRFSTGNCRFLFGRPDTGCPYIVTAGAAFRHCGGTLDECSARGDDMRQRNLGSVLPEQFGAFPGMADQ